MSSDDYAIAIDDKLDVQALQLLPSC